MFIKKKLLNRPLKILLITNSVILLSAAMLGPIYAIFVNEVGGDLMDAATAGGVFAIVATITTIISGRYSDKIRNNKNIIVLGYSAMGIGFLLFTQVHSVLTLFMVQALIGFGEAIYSPAFDALYSKNLNWGKAGTQWGAWESTNYLTTAIGAIIGGAVATYLGFNALFILMFSLCISSAFYVYFLKRGEV